LRVKGDIVIDFKDGLDPKALLSKQNIAEAVVAELFALRDVRRFLRVEVETPIDEQPVVTMGRKAERLGVSGEAADQRRSQNGQETDGNGSQETHHGINLPSNRMLHRGVPAWIAALRRETNRFNVLDSSHVRDGL